MAHAAHPSPAEPGTHRWYLVANGSRARAYVQRIGSPGYDVVQEWDEPEARMHDSELGEDRPGRVFPGAGATQRSGIDPEDRDATPKGHAQHALMERILHDLTHALREGRLSGVALLAPAPLLHRMLEGMPHDLRHAVVGEASGDFTQRPTADVFAHLDLLRRGGG